jgi:hypothetical protein
MVIYTLVQTEAGIAKFIQLICVFDVIAYLIINDTGRVDKPCE